MLVSVTAGREPHTLPAASAPAFDAHNYLDLVYSEPVMFGEQLSPGVHRIMPRVAVVNFRTGGDAVFSAGSGHGNGDIQISGPNVVYDGMSHL